MYGSSQPSPFTDNPPLTTLSQRSVYGAPTQYTGATDYGSTTNYSSYTPYQGYDSSAYYPLASSPDGSSPSHHQVVQIAVPNSIVGCILGRGGSTMLELQSNSGARIKISQRGEYLPNTENRVVTITGTVEACHAASLLITNKLRHNRVPHSKRGHHRGGYGGGGQVRTSGERMYTEYA